MRRNLWLLLTVFILSVCCGCGALDEAKNNLTSAAIANKLDAANKAGMSEKAKAAAEDVQEALDKLNKQDTTLNPFKAMTDDTLCMPWNKSSQNKKLNKGLEKANSSFDKQLKADGAAGAVQHFQNKTLYVVILLLIVAVVILYLWYKKKYMKPKRKLRRVEAEPEVEAAPASAGRSKSGLYDVYDYQTKELQSLCKEAGIDYEAVIEKYGSDLESITRTTNKLSRIVSKGDEKALAKFME